MASALAESERIASIIALKDPAMWPTSSLEVTGTRARTSPWASAEAASVTSETVLRIPRMITTAITATAPTTPNRASSTSSKRFRAAPEKPWLATMIESMERSSTSRMRSMVLPLSSHHSAAVVPSPLTERFSWTVPIMDRTKLTSGPWKVLR